MKHMTAARQRPYVITLLEFAKAYAAFFDQPASAIRDTQDLLSSLGAKYACLLQALVQQ
jgi:hypothetical protein